MQATIIEKKQVYSGFFNLNQYKITHDLYSGDVSPVLIRECFERGPASGVLAFDPIRDKVVLIEQFRIGAFVNNESGWVYEIIAGIIEDNQSPEDVAIRESEEEAGCVLLDLEPICNYYSSPGGTSEILYLYCAAVDSRDIAGHYGLTEEGEDIKAIVLDYKEAVRWLEAGKLNNASTIICMQWLTINHDTMVKKWQKVYSIEN
ncbi:MAG: NUDIX domain-containing protein [Pseudomonadota bacterium]